MTRLPVLSARKILRPLKRAGFQIVGQKGSHIRLQGVRKGRVRTVIVPNHPQIARGTMSSILRQAGLDRDEFIALL